MKKVMILILMLLVFSCKENTTAKKTKLPSSLTIVDSIAIYNNILNDLVDTHLYNRYLGEQSIHLLINHLFHKNIDSIAYQQELKTLKKKIIKNGSLKGTLFINDNFNGSEIDISFIKSPEEFNIDQVAIQIKKKNHLPVKLLTSNFVKLKELSLKQADTLNTFDVGNLSLSKFILNNDKSRGMMYFSFICGNDCGEASILIIKKKNNTWFVQKKHALWVI
ncbi:hypothetical protein [Algibacter mikhailovii]|uniref:hypothetical protein n=1 Tax=Algibacter mikhailovii TaxID=425498 RepID=UPI002494C4B2|nr:hypothetical protein [Algibacter mikhailovii]